MFTTNNRTSNGCTVILAHLEVYPDTNEVGVVEMSNLSHAGSIYNNIKITITINTQ